MEKNQIIESINTITYSQNTKNDIWQQIINKKSRRIFIIPKAIKIALIVLFFLAILVPSGVYAAKKAGILKQLTGDEWVDQQIEYINCADRYDGFELSYYDDGRYRLYNEKRGLELITDNYSYTDVVYNEETLRLNGSYAYISGTGDYSEICFEDLNSDGKEELLIIFHDGGTVASLDYNVQIVELSQMYEYNLDNINEEIEIDQRDNINNLVDSILFKKISIIEINDISYDVVSITDNKGIDHIIRGRYFIPELDLGDTEIKAEYIGANYITEHSFFNRETGLCGLYGTISICNESLWFGYALVPITYNQNAGQYQLGDIAGYVYADEVTSDDFTITK